MGTPMEAARQELLLCFAVLDASPMCIGQPQRRLHLSASSGLVAAEPGDTVESILARADRDLYADKSRRRARAS